MIPMDNPQKWLPLMNQNAHAYLSKEEYNEFSLIPEKVVENELRGLLEKPVAKFTLVNEVYFRGRWAEVLQVLNSNNGLKLFEIAAGDADMIPQAMARAYPGSHYITANMNKLLNTGMVNKTRTLPLKMEIIEDDAANIANYLGENNVDIIAFQHAINDVMQAILCDREGVDTICSDWMQTLPRMIEILQRETSEGTFEKHVKTPFLELARTLLKVLKKDGVMVMNHYMFQLDLDWGYPPDLFEKIVPITREWLKELKGCKEIFFDGFDANWWIFLQKKL